MNETTIKAYKHVYKSNTVGLQFGLAQDGVVIHPAMRAISLFWLGWLMSAGY